MGMDIGNNYCQILKNADKNNDGILTRREARAAGISKQEFNKMKFLESYEKPLQGPDKFDNTEECETNSKLMKKKNQICINTLSPGCFQQNDVTLESLGNADKNKDHVVTKREAEKANLNESDFLEAAKNDGIEDNRVFIPTVDLGEITPEEIHRKTIQWGNPYL